MAVKDSRRESPHIVRVLPIERSIDLNGTWLLLGEEEVGVVRVKTTNDFPSYVINASRLDPLNQEITRKNQLARTTFKFPLNRARQAVSHAVAPDEVSEILGE